MNRMISNPPRPRFAARVAGWVGLGAIGTATTLTLILVGAIYAVSFVFMIYAPYWLFTHDHPIIGISVALVVAWTMILGWRV